MNFKWSQDGIQGKMATLMFLRIDRYIARYFLGFYFAGLVVFIILFLAIDFTTAFKKYAVDLDVLLRYYAYFLPQVLHQMHPVACLVACIFTLTTMQKNNELVALFSSGMSLTRVAAPILALVVLFSSIVFFIGDRVVPKFTQKRNYIYYFEIVKKPSLYSTVKTNKIWYRFENQLFNIQSLDPEKKLAQGLTLYYFDPSWQLIQLIKAKTVQLRGSNWELQDGLLTLFTGEVPFPMTKSFDKKVITMDEDLSDIQSSVEATEVMSLEQLKRFITRNKASGLNTLSYEVEYHGKFGFHFSAIVMSLLAIPFSVGKQRSRGVMVNIAVCIFFAFFYWILFSSFLTLGRHGILPPILAAWTPNIGIAAAAIGLLVVSKK